MIYSTRRFVLSLSFFYFVFVVYNSLSIAITSPGEERANLSAFRTFVRFALVWFGLFPLPLCVWEGLRFSLFRLGTRKIDSTENPRRHFPATRLKYSRTSMARTSFGPWKFVRDMSSSSHRGLIMAQFRKQIAII